MKRSTRLWVLAAAVVAMASAGRVSAQAAGPYQLLDDEPDNVYAQNGAPSAIQLTNEGGVHFSFDTTYLSAYMYRGVDQSTLPLRNEHALQFDGRLEFDLGKLPHPFIGVFSNIFNDDPVSRFEEVRPYAGLEWTLRPVTISTGFNGYIFPEREGLDTQEVWAQIRVDDSRFFHTDRPFLNPYVYGAYDFDKYQGFYLEAGIRHDFPIADTGLVLSAISDFAYVAHDRYFLKPGSLNPADTGLQHYDAGAVLTYDLGSVLKVPARFGDFRVKAMVFYTGPVNDQQLRGDSRVWGGVGLDFKY